MFYLGLLLLGCSQLALAKTVTYNWSIDWVNRNPDGAFPRPVIGINGEWPCPQIDVDLGDYLIVNIYNNLGNESTGLHWHGINQYGHTQMDGSAGAAQCPVPPNSTFTYSFPVSWIPFELGMATDSFIRSTRQAPIGTTRTLKANTQMACGGLLSFTTPTLPSTSTKSLQ